jgi:BirA family biotin operon repressor/biotin-[acetyl-CoA-carboxylase] ligase
MTDSFYRIRYAEETDSTNLWIRRLHDEGAPEGTVACADTQTAGRGRRGRTWFSPKGSSIAFSILLEPKIAEERAPMLSLVMGLAVRDALRELTGCEVRIKWPNDAVISGKKICGILTEMILNGSDEPYVIVGTGINNGIAEFGDGLKDRATSILLETGKAAERDAVLEKVLNHFLEDYRLFLKDGNLESMKDRYNRALVSRGKDVIIMDRNGNYTARSEGIDASGALIIEKEDGTKEAITSGEVSVRGLYGYA